MEIVLTQEIIKIIAVLTVCKYLFRFVEKKVPWIDDIVLVGIGIYLAWLVKFDPHLYETIYDGVVAVGVVLIGKNFISSNEHGSGGGTNGK